MKLKRKPAEQAAIGYVTPKDMLAGHQQEIPAERDRKLETAREQRKNRRHWAAWRGLLATGEVR